MPDSWRHFLQVVSLSGSLLLDVGRFLQTVVRPRAALSAEILFLRKQLAFYQGVRPCREVPGESSLPESAMGIAFEMARLVLEMRSNGRNTSVNKRRLERLAVRFLRLAGQKKPASVTALGGETKESGYTM